MLNKYKHGSSLMLFAFLMQLSMMLQTASGFFTGLISVDDSKIQMRDRTFTFNLSHNTKIVQNNSKIVIRFPDDFQEQFTVTDCTSISGFSSGTNGQELDCVYTSSVNILTIYLPLPPDLTLTELKFTVKGVTNPLVATMTGFFTVTSYEKKSNGRWSALENSDGSLRMNFSPGALSTT